MSEINFTQFLKQYGLQAVSQNTDEIVPGTVLEKRFLRSTVEHCGHLSASFSSMPRWFWDTDLDRANLIHSGVTRTIDHLSTDVLAGLKLHCTQDIENTSVRLAIQKVIGRGFRVGPGRASKFSLLTLLNNLRSTQPERWKKLEEKWVVLEVYYWTEAVLEFSDEMDPEALAPVDQENSEVQWEWLSKRRAIVQQAQVPFAFCGFKV